MNMKTATSVSPAGKRNSPSPKPVSTSVNTLLPPLPQRIIPSMSTPINNSKRPSSRNWRSLSLKSLPFSHFLVPTPPHASLPLPLLQAPPTP